MENSSILIAFSLSLIAGLSTGIGGLIAFFSKRTNTKFLSLSLGLSAGVMIYVSFMELMPEAVEQLSMTYSERVAEAYMLLAFFGGIALIALIDRLVPEDENPHEVHTFENDPHNHASLKRTGVMTAVAIAIHNFPEGLATFTTALTDIKMAIPIVVAIAIHNIPEGMAVSIPLYHATGSKKKAFWYSLLSGVAEPIGALAGYMFLSSFWNSTLNAFLLAGVSGIMIYISFDELLPNTERYGHHHHGITGIILGMAIMAISLVLL